MSKMYRLECWWFKYFSYATVESKDQWLRWVVYLAIFIPALTGCILDFLFIGGFVFEMIAVGILVPFSILWITVYFYHNRRIKKLNKQENESDTD
jgi:Flp pilus assembly protein TadB